ncbi:MAG: hemerythrin domain-containing protein [bacterium]
MIELEEFGELFEEEHRSILDQTKSLIERLRETQTPDISNEVDKLNELLGPHFRYEEEALYPSLKEEYGRVYVKRLYDSHEGTIHTVRKLKGMTEDNEVKTREALELIYGWLLPHVSDCEGLSIMVDQIPSDTLDNIVESRQRAHDEGLDLLTWADRRREKPDFGTLTIYE